MTALKNRLAASGILLLFLLDAFTTLVQHVGAQDSPCYQGYLNCIGPEDEDGGFAELSECIQCYQYSDYTDEVSECKDNLIVDGMGWCDYYAAQACCADSFVPVDCFENEDFVAYSNCLWSYSANQNDEEDCTTPTCSGGIFGGDSGVGSTFPSAMLTFVLGLAFLAAAPFVDFSL